MDTLTLPARPVPVIHEADVLVAGAGWGGVCAALAAARAGARTVLVERNAYPGGVATAGLMCSMTNHLVTRDGAQIARGLPTELMDRVVAAGGALPDYARAGQPQIPYDPEVLKHVFITALADAGVTTVYGSFLADAAVDDARVAAVVLACKGGPVAIRAAQWVDATGDLDLFRLGGGPCDAVGGFSTLLFRMAGVDLDAVIDWLEAHPDSYSPERDIPTSLADTIRNWRTYGVFHLPHYAGRQLAVIRDALAAGRLAADFGRHTHDLWAMGMFASRATPGTVLINSCAFMGDDLDVLRKSECEAEGRLAAQMLADFLVREFPGFARASLLDTGAEIGTRFTHRMRGLHLLTVEEYRRGTRFPDVVGRTTEIDRMLTPPARYAQAGEIPLRCLVAAAPANVICGSGKSASTEPCGLLRGQVGCAVVGQAAGVAAALAARDGWDIQDVAIATLQDTLQAQGVDLGR